MAAIKFIETEKAKFTTLTASEENRNAPGVVHRYNWYRPHRTWNVICQRIGTGPIGTPGEPDAQVDCPVCIKVETEQDDWPTVNYF